MQFMVAGGSGLAEKVLAAVATNVKETTLREFPMPEIPPDAGLLKVEIVGVCGTDVSYYGQFKQPMILGHHVVGRIAKIGSAAAKRWGMREGDRVVMEEYIPCGQCGHCRTGMYRSCSATDPRSGGIRYGATPISIEPSLYGGFSQYMYLHPNAVIHKMPEHVIDVEAALTLPLSNGFEWMCRIGGASPGKTVVIQGPGQQGLACALAAKAAGAEVIVAGRSTSIRRLQLAKDLGADHIVNTTEEDLIGRVREITAGKMADIVIDVTSGGAGPVQASLQLAARGGKVIFGAYKYQTIADFDLDLVIKKTLRLEGVRGHSYESVRMAVDCIASGRFPLKSMNSHNYALQDTDMALKTAGGEGEPFPLLVTVSPWK
jgi:threonine dehydrogenase-like Zn-dependent dehydrogenase